MLPQCADPVTDPPIDQSGKVEVPIKEDMFSVLQISYFIVVVN